MKNIPLLVATVIGSLALIFGIAAIFSGSGSAPADRQFTNEEVVGTNPHTLRLAEDASGSASVTIVEFSDFECPACASAEPTLKALLSQYPDEVELVYRHFPLSNIHAYAQLAAQASEVAAEQDEFWAYHDLLFDNQNEWSSVNSRDTALDLFIGYMTELDLDTEGVAERIESQEIKDRVLDDLSAGNQLGVQGTPTFYVNGEQTTAQQLPTAVQSVLQKTQQ